jgi:hypothetical protein
MPKPKSSVTKAFRVRVDAEGDELVNTFCKKYSSTYILVHHITTTENPHYHAYIETWLSQGNFSNKIKEELGVKGGDYSNKSCDPDRKIEYLSYLFNTKKGNQPRLVEYQGFSPLDVATYKANAQQIAKEFATRIKEGKKTQVDVVHLVLDRIHPDQTVFPNVIYEQVITVLKESRMMARPNHVKDIIASVMAFSDNKRARQQIKELTLKFFSLDRT